MTESREVLQRAEPIDADLRRMVEFIPQLAWMARADGFIFWYNQRWFDYTGTTLDDMEGWGWRQVHHPDHVDRVVRKIRVAFQLGEFWEDTFPLRNRDGEYRWFLSRACPIRDDDGKVVRWFGTNTDITEQREHETRLRRLMYEVDHRARNALGVAQAVVHLTGGDSIEAYKRTVSGRIASLVRSHNQLASARWEGSSLTQLVNTELAPYLGGRVPRVLISGEDVAVPPLKLQTVGLILHELLSNAADHGALSGSGGRVIISWDMAGEELKLLWREEGGPAVLADRTTGRSGMSLLDRLAGGSEGVCVERAFDAGGVTAEVTLKLTELRAVPLPIEEDLTLPPATGGGRRVLILENDPLTSFKLKTQLRRGGYDVVGPFADPEQACTCGSEMACSIALVSSDLATGPARQAVLDMLDANVCVVLTDRSKRPRTGPLGQLPALDPAGDADGLLNAFAAAISSAKPVLRTVSS